MQKPIDWFALQIHKLAFIWYWSCGLSQTEVKQFNLLLASLLKNSAIFSSHFPVPQKMLWKSLHSLHNISLGCCKVKRERTFGLNYICYHSSLPKVFCKNTDLKNFPKYTGKSLCRSLFLIKQQAVGTDTFCRTPVGTCFCRTPAGTCFWY